MKIKRVSDPIDIKEKIENKIIDWITAGASGQLIIFKPVDDLIIADLAVKRRGEYYKNITIYLRLGYCGKNEKEKIYSSKVLKRKLGQGENWYLLFVYFDVVAQDVMEYVWLVPAIKFSEIAKENKNGDLIFETPINFKAESVYYRFLIDKKDLGNILTRIINEGKNFTFPKIGLAGFSNFKIEELKKFIIESRRNTYAGEGAPIDNPRLKGSTQLEFQKGDWFYQDIYFDGDKNFIGQEIVYYNARPVWSMGYFGEQLPEKATEFLKQTLFDLTEKCRFGEKCEKEKKEFRYEDIGEGTLEKFRGEERISIQGKNIYKLNYQGGLISK